jgi:hypothetical protein
VSPNQHAGRQLTALLDAQPAVESEMNRMKDMLKSIAREVGASLPE